jgi:beta-lactamase regulating signal transducer with metallopeptidase domain
MSALLTQPAQLLAQIFAERLLNTIVEGTAIALFAWILLRLRKGQSSSTRFAVWLAALATIAAMPLFEGSPLHRSVVLAGIMPSALHLPTAWALEIFSAWALIAGTGLARVALSFLRLRKIRRSCSVVDPGSLQASTQKVLQDFGSSRRVILLKSSHARVPAALGFFEPAIVLPAWSFQELAPAELNAVLLHELAHLQRWDDWTNLAQQILRAIFFFHPAVWLIGRGLSLEREMACDDFVLARTSDSRAYAQCLVSVAEKSLLHRGVALAMAAVGHMHQTAQRLARILDSDRPAATGIWKPAVGLVSAFSFLCLFALPYTPQLVDFENSLPLAASTSTANPFSDAATSGAKMIPASLRYSTLPTQRKTAPARKSISSPEVMQPNRTQTSDLEPKSIPAKFLTNAARQPTLIDASAQTSPREAAQPKAVFLLMQTEQVDDSGRLWWSVAVWRLTVVPPSTLEIRKEIAPKTT